jgi:hypothetical protein
VVAARPLLCAQTHIGEGAGRKARGVVGSERALTPGRCSRPGERWPIVVAMRNGEYYLAVVAPASH